MSNVCFAAKNNCHALAWSYGEICVGSNCCGQFGKGLKMWEARLEYHLSELKSEEKFDNWILNIEHIQKKNVRLNKIYHTKYINKCKKMIKYYKSKEL